MTAAFAHPARVVAWLLGGVLLAAVLAGCGSDGDSSDLAKAQEQVRELTAEETARQEALSAASAFVATVTTYSHEEGEHDFAWVDELQDETVREQFKERVEALQNAIVKSQTTARGQVIQSAATVVDATQVEVLAFVEQTITDAEGASSIEQPTISLTMKVVDGEWRVQSLTFLNQIATE